MNDGTKEEAKREFEQGETLEDIVYAWNIIDDGVDLRKPEVKAEANDEMTTFNDEDENNNNQNCFELSSFSTVKMRTRTQSYADAVAQEANE